MGHILNGPILSKITILDESLSLRTGLKAFLVESRNDWHLKGLGTVPEPH